MLTRRPDLAIASAAPRRERSSAALPHRAISMAISSSAAANVLVSGLRNLLHVVYTPMHDTVASLDTSPQKWVLHLDSDSPAEDHCWAMFDVLRILILGAQEAEWAIPAPRLRLLPAGTDDRHGTTDSAPVRVEPTPGVEQQSGTPDRAEQPGDDRPQ